MRRRDGVCERLVNPAIVWAAICVLTACGGGGASVTAPPSVPPTSTVAAPEPTPASAPSPVPINGVSSVREFKSSFEAEAEFYPQFYVVPPGQYGSTHTISTEHVRTGLYSHKAWMTQANDSNNDSGHGYLPHRAYPTVNFWKTAQGSFKGPCLLRLYVMADIQLQNRGLGQINDWFSPITVSPNEDDVWARVVTVGINPDGIPRLVHVPVQGAQSYIFQTSTIFFPWGFAKYTRFDLYIDFDPDHGKAKLWMDGALVSSGFVQGGNGKLANFHAGLYASAATRFARDGVSPGTVFNEDLDIIEVSGEAEADAKVLAVW